jgi:hypothetical protein
MRLKTLTLFLAIQVLSFFVWKTVSGNDAVQVKPVQEPVPVAHAAADQPAVEPDFSVRNFESDKTDLNNSQKEEIKQLFAKLPQGHSASVEKVILDYDPSAYRGLGGNSMIVLRAVKIDMEELIAVLVHEIGHNVDYGYLTPVKQETKSAFKDGNFPLFVTDPSVYFYQISWSDDTTYKKGISNLDFVSGYAMSDPFEDFAETYTYYVLHNADFKALTAESPKLLAKYRFMKYRVFGGAEFDTGDGEIKQNNRPWDTTILSYDLAKLLG